MQNSVVQVYAEQKNKEVTSQEFLDYINQLKEQNPNFKFNQGETKVFDSEEQALANLAAQKQAINTAISNYKQAVEERNTRYEQEKQSVKQQNEQITQENAQKEQEYQAKLSTYNAKKSEVEQWKLANPVITQLDNGIKLRGNYDESKKNSINYFDNIAIDASKEELQKNRYDKLKEKTLSTDYTLTDGVIDCPIEIKKELLDRIDNGFVYLSVGFGNHHLYYYTETSYTEKGHSEKGYFGYVPNAFDNEYDYFKYQLTAYKLYKISDIIMDRGVK